RGPGRGPGWWRNTAPAPRACGCATASAPAARAVARRPSRRVLLAVLIGTDIERLGREALLPAVIDQRLLAPMRHPHPFGAGLGDGLPQFVPVGMVGDHQWQLDARLPGPL